MSAVSAPARLEPLLLHNLPVVRSACFRILAFILAWLVGGEATKGVERQLLEFCIGSLFVANAKFKPATLIGGVGNVGQPTCA